MRVVLCWAGISGYMAACWRALAQRDGVDLRVIAFANDGVPFSQELVAGLNCRLLNAAERDDAALIESLVKEQKPDVLYTSGWFHGPYRRLIESPDFASVPKWLGIDTPWLGTLRQQVGRVALRSLVARADRIFVAGERAWQYMRVLGAPEAKIRRGLYGVDHAALAPLVAQRAEQPGGWPRKFLFIGRYHQDKGIATLVEAYARYRASVGGGDAWPLSCCGTGPLEHLLNGREGIENLGFRQPGEIVQTMLTHGVFVLASHYDPWPLVVVESASAGLPVIHTEACGSAVELVRPYYNGLGVATDDPAALADALRWMHDHPDQLPAMGQRGSQFGAAYSAQAWADRWFEAARECTRR